MGRLRPWGWEPTQDPRPPWGKTRALYLRPSGPLPHPKGPIEKVAHCPSPAPTTERPSQKASRRVAAAPHFYVLRSSARPWGQAAPGRMCCACGVRLVSSHMAWPAGAGEARRPPSQQTRPSAGTGLSPGTMGTPQSWQHHWGTMVRGRHSPQVTAGPREVTAGGMSWKALLNRNRGNWGKHSGKRDRLLRAPRWEKQVCVAGLREALGLSLWGTHTCGFGGHGRARARGWGVTAAQVRGDSHLGEG